MSRRRERSPGVTRSGEHGSASVLVLVLVAVVTTLALAGVTIGGVLVGQRRAAAAADLAALAGAEAVSHGAGSAVPGVAACQEADRVSTANDARLTGCLLEGLEVTVEVTVDVRAALGLGWSVPGRARAGPATVSGVEDEPTSATASLEGATEPGGLAR
ncbi:MAG TPA: Rv3654c family TadE-like protein [Nocardioidaceae bacterium]|nr:Rv3654c family TadE-like protein [Nocardioidaceae bacterium]